MAEIFPDEGLDVILGIFPKGGSNVTTLYVGLFTSSNGGSSVPASSATISSMGSGYAEVSTGEWTTYARCSISAGSWGSVGAKTIWSQSCRGVDGPQVSFTAPTGSYSPTNPMCGFFIADALTGGHAIYYSNFSDNSTISSLALGDVVKVTPTFGFAN